MKFVSTRMAVFVAILSLAHQDTRNKGARKSEFDASCIKFRDKNLYGSSLKLDFDCINSKNPETVDRVIDAVCELWELRDGANTMKS